MTFGISEASQGLKMAMRREMISAGFGQRLANSWRAEVFPKRQSSLRAAGLVYTKASHILEGFENGALIRARGGLWLAIPTPNAPKRGTGGKRISPANFLMGRYEPLRFVFRLKRERRVKNRQ
ncbi:DUF6441 family protein [Bartonella sp. DGB2]|uniref:DUF6441 family protein n=1 Tax=Bartonella sp. DGB2 TaxID=3388426 RepID=UPI0039900F45